MKNLFYSFFFILTVTYSQQKTFSTEEKDSTSYYLELAKFHKLNNDYSSTLKSIQKALIFAETEYNLENQAKVYFMFGKVYQEINRPLEAIDNFNVSVSFYKKIPPKPDLAVAYYEIGVCYIAKKNYSQAEIYFKNAEKTYNSLNIEGATELINLQKGIVYYAKGETKLASKYLNAVILKSNENDQLNAKSEALYYIGLIELEDNRNNLALNYFNRSLELSKKSNNLKLQSNAYKKISNTYENLLNLEQSFKNLKQHIIINDSINEIESKKIGTEDLINFKETERLKTIELLDKEKKEQQRTSKFSKLISILYRVDVSEPKLKSLLKENPNINAGLLIADLMIEIYAAESVILRTEKLVGLRGEEACQPQIAMTQVYLFEAVEKIQTAAKEAIAAFTKGDEQKVMLMGLKRFTKMDLVDTRTLRREIADYMIAKGKYPFS